MRDGLMMSVEEVARELGLHPLTVRRSIARGELPATRVGRRVLIPRQLLQDWLNGRATDEAAERRRQVMASVLVALKDAKTAVSRVAK